MLVGRRRDACEATLVIQNVFVASIRSFARRCWLREHLVFSHFTGHCLAISIKLLPWYSWSQCSVRNAL